MSRLALIKNVEVGEDKHDILLKQNKKIEVGDSLIETLIFIHKYYIMNCSVNAAIVMTLDAYNFAKLLSILEYDIFNILH